ncbi:hypothetical protein ARMGADRAFT_322661 [Armillaria gallica]|uniref:Uncharacterized protein n=1 Tax=Armillaria gallica TaxID=47427 RepID=A0A2H3D859_ARMGA|nr:hypothetical protein ARMGADRAFT_322661 [Armillaria gallica]
MWRISSGRVIVAYYIGQPSISSGRKFTSGRVLMDKAAWDIHYPSRIPPCQTPSSLADSHVLVQALYRRTASSDSSFRHLMTTKIRPCTFPIVPPALFSLKLVRRVRRRVHGQAHGQPYPERRNGRIPSAPQLKNSTSHLSFEFSADADLVPRRCHKSKFRFKVLPSNGSNRRS